MSHQYDICGRDDACALTSRGCAPVTYSACTACRTEGAENIDVVLTWAQYTANRDTLIASEAEEYEFVDEPLSLGGETDKIDQDWSHEGASR